MKKLFFFRSQHSNSGNDDHVSPPSTDKQVSWEKPIEKVDKSTESPRLRRSMSFSSGSFYDAEKGHRNQSDQNGSPCSSSYYSHKQSSRSRPLTPERHTMTKSELSENSSYCSSNVSSKVLDRFIDGEQQMERNEKTFSSMRDQSESVGKWPPRFQSTHQVSSHDARKQKPKSQTFRENKVSQNHVFSNERVRELAEQIVSLQKEVSSLKEKELDSRTKIIMSDKQLEESSIKLKEAKEENQYMRKKISEMQDKFTAAEEDRDCFKRKYEEKVKEFNDKQLEESSIKLKEANEENNYMQKRISEMQEKFRAAEEDRDCFKRNYEEKVKECKDMHQCISGLQRTSTNQKKTIDGLRELCEGLGNQENLDSGFIKIQVEHMRLVFGVEHALRNEVEKHMVTVDSLRHENIELLNRLKSNGDGTFSMFKLDRELQNRISSLQNEVLPLLINSSKLGRKLFDYVKTNTGCSTMKGQLSDTSISQVLVECEVKLQGLERAAQNLTSSTKTISSVLQEKSLMDFSTPGLDDKSHKQNDQKPEDMLKSELKSEVLLTSLLREKLYSNEVEIEQLQAELAAAVRCNDILKCELQNAMDSFSCVNHEMKGLELQMMKMDENKNRVEGDLQECKKELAVVQGILAMVTEERDLMWEDVKQYSEKNMLLDSHLNILKKKIESLEEDILLKDGHIQILKDSVGKPYDLLTDEADSIENF